MRHSDGDQRGRRRRPTTSGTLVTMPSTPTSRARPCARGSSHVQVLTASPASWQRSIRSARRRSTSHGCSAAWPRVGRDRRSVVGAELQRQPRRAARSGRAAGSGRRWRGGSTRSASVRGRARRASPAPRRRRDRAGRSRLVVVVLDLDVDPAAPRTGVERLAERRHVAGSSCHGVSTMTRPSVTRASWWTTSTPSAVRRTSSSTPSAPSVGGHLERRDGVLRRQPRRAPVGDDARSPVGTVPLVIRTFRAVAFPCRSGRPSCPRLTPPPTAATIGRLEEDTGVDPCLKPRPGCRRLQLARPRAVPGHRSRAVLPGRHDGHGARADRAGQAGLLQCDGAGRVPGLRARPRTRTRASGAGCRRRSAGPSAASAPPGPAAATPSDTHVSFGPAGHAERVFGALDEHAPVTGRRAA